MQMQLPASHSSSSAAATSCSYHVPVCPLAARHRRRVERQQLRCQAAVEAPEAEASEVFIRRRAPEGTPSQGCGPVDFKVPQSEANQPRNILEEIVWFKAVEVERWRQRVSLPQLMARVGAAPKSRDFIGALQAAQTQTGKPGLIAEVKKASPSKGIIQPDFDHVRIAKAYEAGGAACLSVLTDSKFFQGDFQFLQDICAAGVSCPLLCKDFIVEAYQLFKARSCGADAVLLIAAVLPNKDLEYLMKVCRTLRLQCLVEVHTVAELERVLKLDLSGAMLGINNRDLGTFKVDLHNNKVIMDSAAGQEAQQRGLVVAGESGIFTPEHVEFVQSTGCSAILVGESLVKQGDPAAAVRALLSLE